MEEKATLQEGSEGKGQEETTNNSEEVKGQEETAGDGTQITEVKTESTES